MFRPPSGQIGRIDANLAALRLIRSGKEITTAEDQRVLARWSGWGAVPAVFDPHHKLGRRYRDAIAEVLSPEEQRRAEASTLNAHYTSPEIAEMMWDMLRRWGVTEGRVLEPGCGVGVFMAGAPRDVRVVGVEMDPATAAICAGLHPRHEVINERLEEFGEDGFVAAIGNVPFSNVHPFDPEHNPNRQLSLHNYALYRALLSLKPGGVLLSVTSRHTLDAQADHQRRKLARWGHFLGAVRLPNTAFTEQAGTAVTADIVAFQRRETPLSDEETADLEEPWLESVPQVCADGAFHMNGWFVANPELVCGRVRLGGMWGAEDARVVLEGDASLVEVVGAATRKAATVRLPVGLPAPGEQEASAEGPSGVDWSPPLWYREGAVFAVGRGFVRITRNKPVTLRPKIPGNQNPRRVKARLRALCHLRDAARILLAAEQAGYGDDQLDRLRSRLDAAYRSARRAYGERPLTRLTANGNRRRAHLGEFRTDPDCGLVLGLEDISRSGKVTRAPIFSHRTVHPDVAPQMVNSIEDAVKASMGRTGRIDLNLMKQITEFDWDETDLDGLAFYDPQGGEWVPSVRYLSGNVRAKLNAVEEANDPRLEPNREALLAVLPKPLESGDIQAGCGTPLLKPDEVQEFIEATLPDSRGNITVHYSEAAGWAITGDLYHGAKEKQDWGTARRTPLEIVAAAWAGRKIEVKDTVYDNDGNRRQVLNEVETAAAAEKTEKWNNRLAEWMWDEEPTRCYQLVERYNDMFNAWVAPRYPADWIGRPPGLATGIEPYEHQAVAAAHIVDVGDFLLGHSVGAGKTMTMAIAAQESKRLGLIRKAAFVVPNHLVTDFAVEYQRAFPNARLLVPDEGRTPGPEEREEFVARCAWGDWDGIIVSHSLFTMLKLRPETRAQYLHEELVDWREALESYRAQTEDGGRDRLTVRRMQKAIEQREAQLKELIETQYVNREPCYWEDLGVDYLFVDEAHEFKNLSIPSMNRDLAFRGSGKATGLDMKLRWMRSHYDRPYGVVTVATGTPIANKLIELAVMQRYVMPDMLRESGLFRFDDWVAQFGQRKGASELTAAGRGYRWRERIARYTNMPELFNMLAVRADIRSAEQLGLDRPALVGAEPTIHTAAPTPHLNGFMDGLDERQQNLEQPDNMLAVCTDAQKASLHLGLVGLPQHNPSKVLHCAEEVADIYRRYADVEYRSEDPNAQPGALQVVFCDKGVPGGASTVPIYDILASHMTKGGVPREKIQFIHDYKTPAAKSGLNKRCRTGEVAVLIGSTAKMGTGMNIQDRMIALHHLDYPWRPADFEQREGRILRPKNQNPQVFINYYLTEGSADAFSLQTIQRKQVLIDQFRSGTSDRVIEDIDTGSDAAVFGAIKALATGDPRSVRLNELNSEITQVATRHQARVVQQQRLRRHIQTWERAIPKTEQRIQMLTELAEDPGDLEDITLPEWQERPDEVNYWNTMASHGPNHWLWRGMAVTEHRMWSRDRRFLGRLGHIDIHLARRPYNRRSAMFAIELGHPNAGLGFVISRKDWSRHFHNPNTKRPVQMDKRIGHAVGRIPHLIGAAQEQLEEIKSELPSLRDAVRPVDRTELDILEAERDALEEDITNNPIERILPEEDLPGRHLSL